MTWYCWVAQVIMVIALTARHLTSRATENDRSVNQGESPAVAVHCFVRSGINDETYRQRIM
jgi:hypothetical protein